MRIIAGIFKGRPLCGPKSAARPSSERLRGALFNICQDVTGLTLLDLFAGSGAVGFEALSRGARHVTFVDNDKDSLAAIRKNAATLHLEDQITILPYSAERALKRGGQFDLIFIDPPYDLPADPYITAAIPLLNAGGSLFVEDRKGSSTNAYPLPLQSSRLLGDSRLRHYTHH